jgi:hypothetical protein
MCPSVDSCFVFCGIAGGSGIIVTVGQRISGFVGAGCNGVGSGNDCVDDDEPYAEPPPHPPHPPNPPAGAGGTGCTVTVLVIIPVFHPRSV